MTSSPSTSQYRSTTKGRAHGNGHPSVRIPEELHRDGVVRVVPHNREAEQAIISSVMMGKEAYEEVRDMLRPESFWVPAHQTLYRAIADLYRKGQPADIVTLQDHLRGTGELEDVGGLQYLLTTSRAAPSSANVRHYARIVVERAIKRQIIAEASLTLEECYSPETDAFEIQEKHVQRAMETANATIQGAALSMAEVAEQTMAYIERAKKAKDSGRLLGLSTGYRQLDRRSAGWMPGDLVVLAARPSQGKTAFAMNILENVARSGIPVAVFSMEMPAQQLVLRMLANEMAVDSLALRRGELTDDDLQRASRVLLAMSALPIYFDDQPALSLRELRSRSRIMIRRHGCRLIAIDYLGLATNREDGGNRNREQEVAGIVRGIKQIAREEGVVALALAQLNRGNESRANKQPVLSDLRDSGEIEQGADHVLFIHRPYYYGITTDENYDATFFTDSNSKVIGTIANIITAKGRNSECGIDDLIFQNQFCRFTEPAIFHERNWEVNELPPVGYQYSPDETPF